MGNQATTIEEQLALLQSRGMSISDEDKAKEVLLDIGYFRLGFYCFPLEKSYPQKNNRTHDYKEGTSFDDVVKLYYFDYNLRGLLLKYINRIEINFRTFLTYTVSNAFPKSPTWFADPSIVMNSYANKFSEKVYDDKFKLNPVIKRHHTKHINDRYAPAWKTIEFMTLGSVYVLFQSLRDNELKRVISSHFGINNVDVFENYIETIRTIRNICAHGGVLFDTSLAKSIKRGPAGKMDGQNHHNLNGAIQVIHYMLNQVSVNRATDMQAELKALFDKYKAFPTVQKILKEATGIEEN